MDSDLTLTSAARHLSSEVSKTAEYVACQQTVSAVKQGSLGWDSQSDLQGW